MFLQTIVRLVLLHIKINTMKKLVLFFLYVVLTNFDLIAQSSDIVALPVPIEITKNTGLTVSNKSTYGVTFSCSDIFGKEVTIPLNITADIAPTVGFAVDLQQTYTINDIWSYTIKIIGDDNQDIYYWTTRFRKLSINKAEISFDYRTPNKGYGIQDWHEIDAIPQELNLILHNGELLFSYRSINDWGQINVNQYRIQNALGISGITFKISKGLTLRIQNPRIAVPSEYANNLIQKTPSNNKPGEYIASGSGFVITSNGIIATNYHVIEDAKGIDILVNRNGEVKTYKAKVIISDKTNDISLLRIEDNTFTNFPNLPYAIKTNVLDVGTSVFAMGYPMSNILGEEIKVTDGIISAKTGYQGDIVTYQISSPIQRGNSGGPLFDKSGNLVGITNAGVPDAQNVGYAIKSSYLKNLVDVAPISITLPSNNSISGLSFTEKIKRLTPYVVLIKVY